MKKLYTILIVEDEDIVREGLVETVEWEKIGFCVTAQASGGREALRKFQTEPTDVVLTDIRMPEFDGIQLQKAIKEQRPETQVVFISSYAEFEYAKQAIAYKAFSYVIKTQLFEELEKVLHELYLFLEKQEFVRRQANSQKRMIESQQLFKGLQTGKWEEIQLRDVWYQVVVFSQYPEKDIALPAECEVNVLWGISGRGDAVFLVSADNRETVEKCIQSLARKFLAKHIGVIAVGKCKQERQEIQNSYYEAMKMLDITYKYPSGVYMYQTAESSLARFDFQKSWSTDQLVLLLMHRKTEEFLQQTERYINCCMKARGIFVQECRLHLLSVFSRIAEIYGGEIRELYYSVTKQLINCDCFTALYPMIEKIVQQVLETLNNAENNDEMKQILAFVQANFQSDIQLQDIAERFFLSTPYLSALFKKHVGMTFTSYLRECRLNWATHLLETTCFSVQRIALEVGYTDKRYFVDLFNKAYKMSPTEYRTRFIQKRDLVKE